MADDMAGSAIVPVWEAEDIPDDAYLYLRVHRAQTANGQVTAGAFRDSRPKDERKIHPPDRMSTDWQKYATCDQTRNRARKPAQEYAIIKLRVGDVRKKVSDQSVVHSPDATQRNQAHTDVYGRFDVETRDQYLEICTVLCMPDDAAPCVDPEFPG